MRKADIIKFGVELSGFVASMIAYIHSKKKLNISAKLLEFIKQAYIFTPKTLIDIIQEHSPQVFSENFLDYKENEHSSLFTAFLKGQADSAIPFQSALNPKKNLLSSKIKAQPLYSNASSIEGRDYAIRSKNVKNLLIKDPHYVNTVLVKNIDKCQTNYALHKVAEKSDFREFNLFEIIITKLIWLIQLSLGIIRIYPRFKGFLMGIKTSEHGIETGQSILTFGEVKFDKLTKTLVMNFPSYFLNDKNQLVDFQQIKNLKWKRISSASMLFGLIFGLLLIRRLSKFGYRLFEKIRDAIEAFKLKKFKLRGFAESIDDDYKCIICIESVKSVIFRPCLHMALCKVCFESLIKKECPICKSIIKGTVNVFLV